MPQNSWFAVDKEGLRKLVDHRGKGLVLFELVQNAWDTEATRVAVTLEKLPGRPYARLVIQDDHPDGFANLAHAYTLFAESEKKSDPTRRGFMNLGEKLVLSLCRWATIQSTKGTVTFNDDGTMTKGRRKTDTGTIFTAEVRMKQEEFDEAIAAFWTLIPCDTCRTTLNGEELTAPKLVCEFETTLPTRIADAEGNMRSTRRKTVVRVYEPREGETASIYEMGIPVVDTDGKYHVSVEQKVPVTMDRTNVPPSYLTKIRAEVLNRTAKHLTEEDASESWVSNALESDDVTDEAVLRTADLRFGDKRAIFDPSDTEANATLQSRGYTVIPGAAFSKAAWDSMKRAKAARPAGQIAPSPKLYSDDPNAPEREQIHPDNWTPGMREVADITRWFAREMDIHDDLLVMFILPRGPHAKKVMATWGSCGFEWNVTALGKAYFDKWHEHPVSMLDTIIHELAHDEVSIHNDPKFHEACTSNGALMALLAFVRGKEVPHFRKHLPTWTNAFPRR